MNLIYSNCCFCVLQVFLTFDLSGVNPVTQRKQIHDVKIGSNHEQPKFRDMHILSSDWDWVLTSSQICSCTEKLISVVSPGTTKTRQCGPTSKDLEQLVSTETTNDSLVVLKGLFGFISANADITYEFGCVFFSSFVCVEAQKHINYRIKLVPKTIPTSIHSLLSIIQMRTVSFTESFHVCIHIYHSSDVGCAACCRYMTVIWIHRNGNSFQMVCFVYGDVFLDSAVTAVPCRQILYQSNETANWKENKSTSVRLMWYEAVTVCMNVFLFVLVSCIVYTDSVMRFLLYVYTTKFSQAQLLVIKPREWWTNTHVRLKLAPCELVFN